MNNSKNNAIASAIKVVAYVDFVLWFIIGLMLGRDLYGDFSFGSCLIYWAVGFISGIMLLGFAEIIQLLHSINEKTPSLSVGNSDFDKKHENGSNNTPEISVLDYDPDTLWQCQHCGAVNSITDKRCKECDWHR